MGFSGADDEPLKVRILLLRKMTGIGWLCLVRPWGGGGDSGILAPSGKRHPPPANQPTRRSQSCPAPVIGAGWIEGDGRSWTYTASSADGAAVVAPVRVARGPEHRMSASPREPHPTRGRAGERMALVGPTHTVPGRNGGGDARLQGPRRWPALVQPDHINYDTTRLR